MWLTASACASGEERLENRLTLPEQERTLAGWDKAYEEPPEGSTVAETTADEDQLQPAEAVEAFQARGVKQGQQFDEQCRLVLRGLGFQVSDKPFPVAELGVEFDAEIKSQSGRVYWCEFKGSWHGPRPGLRRTDTVKKALADAFIAHAAQKDYPPTIFLTTHTPAAGSSGEQMLEVAKSSGALLDVINVNEPKDMERLQKLANDR